MVAARMGGREYRPRQDPSVTAGTEIARWSDLPLGYGAVLTAPWYWTG
jgi:hypothetical protein